MSIKNFKISTGLDLEGLVLTNGGDGELHLDGAALATQQYVIDSIAGVDVDLSDNAGAYLDWNAGSSEFDVDIEGIATDLVANAGFATESYVTSQGYITAADVPAQFITSVDGSGPLKEFNGQLSINLGYGVKVGYDASLIPVLDVDTDIIATQSYVTGLGYLTSTDLNGYATESYVTTALNDYTPTSGLDTAIAGYGYAKTADLPTMYTDADALDAVIQSSNIGTGLTIGMGASLNPIFEVDTTVIATKAYVDGVAQGLTVETPVKTASTANITLSGEGVLEDGQGYYSQERVLVRAQTTASDNGLYIVNKNGAWEKASDDLTTVSGSFVFVREGASAGKGYVKIGNDWNQFSEAGQYITSVGTNLSVADGTGGTTLGQLNLSSDVVTKTGTQDLTNKTLVSPTIVDAPGVLGSWSVSPTEISYLDGVTSAIQTQLNAKQATLQFGNGIAIDISNTLSIDLNDIAGTGITVNGNQLEAAPAYIESVDASFSVTDGELSLSDTITIASVELTDSVANVTAASDVFGNGSTLTYAGGSAVTVGTLPTGADVADVFITLAKSSGGVTSSRTSKLTYVNTGGDAPTWTEYGIIVSGSFPATTVSFDSSGNIIANVTGSDTYSVKGVVTILK